MFYLEYRIHACREQSHEGAYIISDFWAKHFFHPPGQMQFCHFHTEIWTHSFSSREVDNAIANLAVALLESCNEPTGSLHLKE
jgi:hypothetical protein